MAIIWLDHFHQVQAFLGRLHWIEVDGWGGGWALSKYEGRVHVWTPMISRLCLNSLDALSTRSLVVVVVVFWRHVGSDDLTCCFSALFTTDLTAAAFLNADYRARTRSDTQIICAILDSDRIWRNFFFFLETCVANSEGLWSFFCCICATKCQTSACRLLVRPWRGGWGSGTCVQRTQRSPPSAETCSVTLTGMASKKTARRPCTLRSGLSQRGGITTRSPTDPFPRGAARGRPSSLHRSSTSDRRTSDPVPVGRSI